MAILYGGSSKLAEALCEALGLEVPTVYSVNLDLKADAVVRAVVVQYVTKEKDETAASRLRKIKTTWHLVSEEDA